MNQISKYPPNGDLSSSPIIPGHVSNGVKHLSSINGRSNWGGESVSIVVARIRGKPSTLTPQRDAVWYRCVQYIPHRNLHDFTRCQQSTRTLTYNLHVDIQNLLREYQITCARHNFSKRFSTTASTVLVPGNDSHSSADVRCFNYLHHNSFIIPCILYRWLYGFM